MSANPTDPRTKRRQAAGDDPNKMSIAPQPIPGMPQNQKGGNVMNNPAFDVNGQMGQKIGGPASMTYGDMGLSPDDGRLGNVGFVEPSGQPENIVPGRGQNSQFAYNKQPQPDSQMMMNMEPMYEMAAASGNAVPGGLNNGLPVSYNISSMGPLGSAVQMDPKTSPQLTYADDRQLGLQGFKSAEDAVNQSNNGMSTGRGGGRNKGKN